MLINFKDNNPEREKKVKEVLPAVPFTQSIVFPALWELMLEPLLRALIAEIEVYKAYPKRGKFDLEAFNPRNNKTCFMGLGFKANDNWTDAELRDYRKAVGTFSHEVWGKGVTLLEIWGGDHFEKYPKMVREVFKYAYGGRKTRPEVKFHVMPLVITEHTGTMIYNEEQLAVMRAMQLAQENEIRRGYGLPAQDYLAEEIEQFRKDGLWDDRRNCLNDDEDDE